jgi:parallel beta-helix repeat protein
VALVVAEDQQPPDAGTGSVATIVVDSTLDTNARDAAMTLREALLLATGVLAKSSLTPTEQSRVTGDPGPDSFDTITFALSGFPAEIHTTTGFPSLFTGHDAVNGVAGRVRIVCDSIVTPFLISSSGNVVSGLEIEGCNIAILVRNEADDNVIGGPLALQGNVLVDNGIGISIENLTANPERNRVVGNHIGVRRNALVEAGNITGVSVLRATGTVIEGNVISGNDDAGVRILADDNIVRGNRIGTNTSGLVAVPNAVGVLITPSGTTGSASRNVIGGSTEAERNVISGNGVGVQVETLVAGHQALKNHITGNYLGVTANGMTPLPNGTGVRIAGGASANTIGVFAPGASNLIAFNEGAGVSVEGDGARSNLILDNAIHSNGALAIDLGGDGVTPNDDTDGVGAGPNGFQNFPVITRVAYLPAEPPAEQGMLVVEGTLESAPLEPGLRVQFFLNAACDPSGHGEAQLPMPALESTLTIEADGSVGFVSAAVMPVPALRVLTANATSLDDRGTSEMSACAMLVAGAPCDGDADCDDGDACTGVETCVDAACQGGTPLPCDDGRACNGAATCADGGCRLGEPLDCDDTEHCTDDGCDDARGCVHTPRTGVAAVTCRLDTIADLLAAAEVPDKLRRKLETRIDRARTRLDAVPSDAGEQPRVLKKARRQLTAFGKTAARQRGRKLSETTADALAGAADDALGRLAALESALATAESR